MSLLPWWVKALVAAALVAAVTYAVHRYNESLREEGRAEVRAELNVAVLKANEKKRLDELALTRKNEGIDREFAKLVQARHAADARSADSLQRLNAALAAGSGTGAPHSAPSGSLDDPRDTIISECAGALGEVDKTARRLADEKGALQRYAREVCVN